MHMAFRAGTAISVSESQGVHTLTQNAMPPANR